MLDQMLTMANLVVAEPFLRGLDSIDEARGDTTGQMGGVPIDTISVISLLFLATFLVQNAYWLLTSMMDNADQGRAITAESSRGLDSYDSYDLFQDAGAILLLSHVGKGKCMMRLYCHVSKKTKGESSAAAYATRAVLYLLSDSLEPQGLSTFLVQLESASQNPEKPTNNKCSSWDPRCPGKLFKRVLRGSERLSSILRTGKQVWGWLQRG